MQRAPKSLNRIARIGAVLEDKVVARFPALHKSVKVLLNGVDGSADFTPNVGDGDDPNYSGNRRKRPSGEPDGATFPNEDPYWITDDGRYVDADGDEIDERFIPEEERIGRNNVNAGDGSGSANDAGDGNNSADQNSGGDPGDGSGTSDESAADRGPPVGETTDGKPFWFDNDGKIVDAEGKEVPFDQIGELADDYVDDAVSRVSSASADPNAGGASVVKPSSGFKNFLSKNALILSAGLGVALELAIALPFVIMDFVNGEYLAGVGVLVGTTVGAIGGGILADLAVKTTAAAVALTISGRVATFAARLVIGAVPALAFAFLAVMVAIKIFDGGFVDSKPAEEQIVDTMCFGHRGTTNVDPKSYNVTDMEQLRLSPAYVAEKFSGSDMLATQLLFLKYSGGELITRSQLMQAVRDGWIDCDGGEFGCSDYHVTKTEVGLVISSGPNTPFEGEKRADYGQVKDAIDDGKIKITSRMDCMNLEKITHATNEDDVKCITKVEVVEEGKNLTDIFSEVLDCNECGLMDCYEVNLIQNPEKRFCLDYCEPEQKTCTARKDEFDCNQCDTYEKCSLGSPCYLMALGDVAALGYGGKCRAQCDAARQQPVCSGCTADSFANEDQFCNDNCGQEKSAMCSTFCSTEDRENCGHPFCKDHCSRLYCEETDDSVL